MTATPRDKGERFRALHEAQGIFLMPNPWDAGSARLLAAAGFPALATTSAGLAYGLGLPDARARVRRDEAIAHLRAIVEAVDLPVSADLENGFGHLPEDAAQAISEAIAAGAAGGSIEDFSGDPATGLYEVNHAAERIRAAREAADAAGTPFVLTGRAECYLVGHPDPFRESVKRLQRYREAGADCLYAPGIRKPEEIAALVREVSAPVNVVVGASLADARLAELAELGVRRVSLGGTLARVAFAALRRAVEEMTRDGTFRFARDAMNDADLAAIFEQRR